MQHIVLDQFIFCNFITNNMIDFTCSICGRKIKAQEIQTEIPKFICLGSKNGEDIIDKIKTISAMSNQKSSGSLCNDQEIQKRYNICQSCIHFNHSTCSLCGCPLSRERDFVNKLAFKKEKCPEGKWDQES
jgi:hypothetical protein